MKIEEVSEGQWVVYRPAHGSAEDGTVVRVGRSGVVFVLYKGSITPKATNPEDLSPGCPGTSQKPPKPNTPPLFVDDERFPPDDDWVHAMSVQETIEYLDSHDRLELMSLDYVLKDGDAMDILIWLRDHRDKIPVEIRAHTRSSTGRHSISHVAADLGAKFSEED